jgi:hypothetical protein
LRANELPANKFPPLRETRQRKMDEIGMVRRMHPCLNWYLKIVHKCQERQYGVIKM